MESRFRRFVAVVCVLFCSLLARDASAAAGSIRGRVLSPDGRPVSGATLQLRNDMTGFKAETTTDAAGTYQFFNVPFNPYEIHVEVQGFEPVHRSVDVRSAAPSRSRSPSSWLE